MQNAAIIKSLVMRVGPVEIARRHGGVTYQAVQRWVAKGVPPKQVINFCKALDWEITPHAVNPDMYPRPTDGMPKMKQKKQSSHGREV